MLVLISVSVWKNHKYLHDNNKHSHTCPYTEINDIQSQTLRPNVHTIHPICPK